jgi:hypothetical protein
VVSIANGYGLHDQKGQSSNPSRVKNLHFSMLSRLALGPTQTPIQYELWALSLQVKQTVRVADRLLPTSAKVKKM